MSELPPSVVRGSAPKETEATPVAVLLARQLSVWHQAGRWHGLVGVRSVLLDAPSGPCLTEPDSLVRLGESAGDWERLPAVLHDHLPLELSSDLPLARRRLLAAGISIDPVQIDLYSLAALLCRWISGESASAFLRSPKIKRLIPEGLQPVLERALGSQDEHRFVDAAELAQALELADSATAGEDVDRSTESLSSAPSGSQTGDTTPSRISSIPGSDTSVIRPGSEGSSSGASSSGSDKSSNTGPADALPFARLGHYEIRRRIGHGGMGDVYLGYELALNRHVAIKVLPGDLARDQEFVRRFHAEAAAVARLNHPNIVPIHFIGEDQGHHFYAMQFIEGESLADLLNRRGKLSIEEALPIVEQTLAGLGLAHDHGMVHRDIKPGNILIDQKSRRALLADFGLVKSLSSSVTGKTATGVIMGTVDYISPEQGRGQAVDARSDLYSIGVLLFRMLSGRLPFTADSPTALIFQHVYETPPALREFDRTIPESLAALVHRLLAKKPDERYQSTAELLEDIQRIERAMPLRFEEAEVTFNPGTDSVPRHYGWWERAVDHVRTLVRRHSPEFLRELQGTQVQIDGAIALQARRRRRLELLAEEAEEVLRDLRLQASSSEVPPLDKQIDEQQQQVDSIQLRLAQARVTSERLQAQRDVLQARLKVAEARGGSSPDGRIGWRPRWTAGTVLQVFAALAVAGFALFVILDISRDDAARSTDGGTLVEKPATASSAEIAPAVSSEARRPKPLLPLLRFNGHDRWVRTIAFSPDGNVLAASDANGIIRLWNCQSGGLIATLPEGVAERRSEINVLAFSPKGRWLVSGDSSSEGSVKLWDVELKSLNRIFPGETGDVAAVGFSRAEDKVFAVTMAKERPTFFEWILLTGMETRHVELSEAKRARICAAQFSPDGTSLALGLTGTGPSEFANGIWNVPLMRPGSNLDVCPVAWDASGSRVATKTKESVTVLSVSDGRELLQTGDLGGRVESVAFGPHERLLVALQVRGEPAGKTLIINIRSGKILRTFEGQRVGTALYSPDGHRIATGGTEPELLLWDADIPPEESKKPLKEEEGKGKLLAVSADGRMMVAGDKAGIRFQSLSDGTWYPLPGWDEQLESLAITPDGRFAAAGGHDGTISLWNLTKRQLVRQTRVPHDPKAQVAPIPPQILSLSFTPNGKRVYALTSFITIIAWDVATGTESVPFSARGSSCMGVCPDGRHLVLGGSKDDTGYLQLWDIETGTKSRRLIGHAGNVHCIAFPRQGQRMYSGANGHVYEWDLDTGNLIRKLKTREFALPWGMSVSPDDRHIAVAFASTIGVWNLATGEEEFQASGQHARGNTLGFAEDGRRLFNATGTGTICTWDILEMQSGGEN